MARTSVAYLERLRRERRAASVSFVLDELIQEAEASQRREAIERDIADYYSNLTPEEAREEAEWGRFAQEQWERRAR